MKPEEATEDREAAEQSQAIFFGVRDFNNTQPKKECYVQGYLAGILHERARSLSKGVEREKLIDLLRKLEAMNLISIFQCHGLSTHRKASELVDVFLKSLQQQGGGKL